MHQGKSLHSRTISRSVSSWRQHRARIALLAIILIGPATVAAAGQAGQSVEMQQPLSYEPGTQLVIKGRVQKIYAPRLFTLEARFAADRELLVLMPRAEATPMAGTAIVAGGVLRRFDQTELNDVGGWNEIDTPTRDGFYGRPVLVATSVTTANGGQLVRQAAGRSASAITRQPSQRERPVQLPAEVMNTVRPSALASLIDELAGQRVRVRNARVVGVLNPRVFLIESLTSFPAMLGTRDRILVLLDGGATLRVAPATIVASSVTLVGVARTLLGVQVTGEVPWPPELTRDVVKRLEVRAALLATSVQTAEGVELTDRPSSRGVVPSASSSHPVPGKSGARGVHDVASGVAAVP